MKAWVLVANASEAKIYRSDNLRHKGLSEVKELKHPESREKGLDLITDRPGKFQSPGAGPSDFERRDPRQVEAENFARELANEIKSGHGTNQYEQLVIIATPHFYGSINGHIDFNKKEFTHIPKDYTKLKPEEILQHIRKFIYGE